MKVDQSHCRGCGICISYCTMGAISLQRGKMITAWIDEEKCVECGTCYRSAVCTQEAIFQDELVWPRKLRRQFSDPLEPHDTGNRGRGTEEMKTNDVTGKYDYGQVGVAVELGRPGIGTSFSDVEKITMAMAELGAKFEPDNPTTILMVDPAIGKMKPEILKERVLSAIVEFITELDSLPIFLIKLKEIAPKLDTVFSLALISRMLPGNIFETEEVALKAGIELRPNAKHNLGLGRLLAVNLITKNNAGTGRRKR